MAPAPAATPLTEATTGLFNSRIFVTIGLKLSERIFDKSGPFGSINSAISCPVLNAFPSPVISTDRMELSSLARSSVSCNSFANKVLKELNTLGLLMVILSTPSIVSLFKKFI